MGKTSVPSLSRRERQILDVIYARGHATAAEVTAELPDAPTYTTVRGLLRILGEKGHVRHQDEGGRYVYFPSTPREDAGASQLQHVVRTFFDGSAAKAMAAFLGSTREALSEDELQDLRTIVENAGKSPKAPSAHRANDAAGIAGAVFRRVTLVDPADVGVVRARVDRRPAARAPFGRAAPRRAQRDGGRCARPPCPVCR